MELGEFGLLPKDAKISTLGFIVLAKPIYINNVRQGCKFIIQTPYWYIMDLKRKGGLYPIFLRCQFAQSNREVQQYASYCKSQHFRRIMATKTRDERWFSTEIYPSVPAPIRIHAKKDYTAMYRYQVEESCIFYTPWWINEEKNTVHNSIWIGLKNTPKIRFDFISDELDDVGSLVDLDPCFEKPIGIHRKETEKFGFEPPI